jgi:hypothetical protein
VTIQKAMASAATASGSTAPINVTLTTAGSGTTAGDPTNVVTCHSTSAGWALESPLRIPDSGNNFWCVDYQGASKGEPASTLTANTYTCG